MANIYPAHPQPLASAACSANMVTTSGHIQQQHTMSWPPFNWSNPLNRVSCCLLSGLPNELEFGLRVTSLLADSRHLAIIASDYRFIETLLESLSLHVCHCSDEEYATTTGPLYQGLLQSSSCPTDTDCNPLSDDSSPRSTQKGIPCVPASVSTENRKDKDVAPVVAKSCYCFQRFWSEVCNDELVMSLVFEETDAVSFRPHLPHIQQEIRARIKRVSGLLRTLTDHLKSTRAESQPPLAASTDPEDMEVDAEYAPLCLIKYASLLLSTDDQELLTIGLDIMSSIQEAPLNLSEGNTYSSLLHFIYSRCVAIIIESPDVDSVQKSLDVMTRVASNNTDNDVKQFFIQIMDQTVSLETHSCSQCLID